MNICVLGDSIAWGAFDVEKGGWVERLKIYLWEKYEGEVYNLGVSGDSSHELLVRAESELRMRECDLVILAIGTNDAQLLGKEKAARTDVSQFEQNLNALLQSMVGENKVLVGLTAVDELKTMPVPWKWDDGREIFYSSGKIRECEEVIKKISKEQSVPHISVYNTLSASDLEDGLHPNTEGHRKLFEHIKAALEEKKLLHE